VLLLHVSTVRLGPRVTPDTTTDFTCTWADNTVLFGPESYTASRSAPVIPYRPYALKGLFFFQNPVDYLQPVVCTIQPRASGSDVLSPLSLFDVEVSGVPVYSSDLTSNGKTAALFMIGSLCELCELFERLSCIFHGVSRWLSWALYFRNGFRNLFRSRCNLFLDCHMFQIQFSRSTHGK
jgi:hypothetical protein